MKETQTFLLIIAILFFGILSVRVLEKIKQNKDVLQRIESKLDLALNFSNSKTEGLK